MHLILLYSSNIVLFTKLNQLLTDHHLHVVLCVCPDASVYRLLGSIQDSLTLAESDSLRLRVGDES